MDFVGADIIRPYDAAVNQFEIDHNDYINMIRQTTQQSAAT
jgi:hypothetical protein